MPKSNIPGWQSSKGRDAMAGGRGGTINKPVVIAAYATGGALFLVCAGVLLRQTFPGSSGGEPSLSRPSAASQTSQLPFYLFSSHLLKGTPLEAVRVHPPGLKPGWLLLTAEDPRPPQPRCSHLYLCEPGHPASIRLLSPESGYNFWDMSVGDVDGDGREEIGLCTFSHTARDPRTLRRFFVYSWDNHDDLYPRWRGSRLCRPYLWAHLADVTGDSKAELVSVERTLSGHQTLVAYEWNQFGFWGLAHSSDYRSITGVKPWRDAQGHKGVSIFADKGHGVRQLWLVLRNGKWEATARPTAVPLDLPVYVKRSY